MGSTASNSQSQAAAAKVATATPEQRTGDPFKDFELDLKKVESDQEATKYIKLGREATYSFIEHLYSTDWQYESKSADGIKMYSIAATAGNQQTSYVRLETKFGSVTVSELVEYFTEVDKRLAWENNYLASLE